NDRIRNGEKARYRTKGEHRGRHCDECVCCVNVTTQKKPRDPRAEFAPAQTPLVQTFEIFLTAPIACPEPHDRNQREKTDEYCQRGIIDTGIHLWAPLRLGRAARTTRYAAHVQPAQRKTHANWYQIKKGKPASVGSTFAKVLTHRSATTGIARKTHASASSGLLVAGPALTSFSR